MRTRRFLYLGAGTELERPETLVGSGNRQQTDSVEGAQDTRTGEQGQRFAYETWCEERVREYLDGIEPARIEKLLREELSSLKRSQPGWYSRVPDEIRREVAFSQMRQTLRTKIPIQMFEEWSKSQAQLQLFE